MDRPIAMKKDGIQTRKRKPKSSSGGGGGSGKESSKSKTQMYSSYQTRQSKMPESYSTCKKKLILKSVFTREREIYIFFMFSQHLILRKIETLLVFKDWKSMTKPP